MDAAILNYSSYPITFLCFKVWYLWIDDQICNDTVLLQVGVSFLSVAIFHLIGPIQVLQGHRGDVNSPVEENIGH